MIKRYPPYKFILAICDFCALLIAAVAAITLSTAKSASIESIMTVVHTENPYYLVGACILILFVFQNYALYKINTILSPSKHAISLLISFFYVIVCLTVFEFFFLLPLSAHSRFALVLFGMFGFVVTFCYRFFLFKPLFSFFNKQALLKRNLLIVGSTPEAIKMAVQLDFDDIYGLRLVGFSDSHHTKGQVVFAGYKNLGGVSEIPQIVTELNIQEILVTLSDVSHEALLEILDICKSTTARVEVTSSLFAIIHHKVPSESYFDTPIAHMMNLSDSKGLFLIKRMIDVVGALVGLIVLTIPFAILSLLIKLTSSGPIFYKQIRIGKGAREFVFYKFRSMYPGSDQEEHREKHFASFIKNGKATGGTSTKIVDEKLITPIGRIIRKTSIDELPQLFNVLKGEMSLVGPRPCLPYEYREYDEWHKRRLSVLPGCTGLWQVSNRSEGSFDDMVLLDLYYIDNMSPWFDLQLILKTIPVMILGRGGK
ncbi:MAG: sugar transferase [Ignavibacteriales bacterium]|nr:sugar transferase [Ignavibacteriales bacterium]